MKKKVSLAKCEDYELDHVKAALSATIEKLGGLERYLAKGDRVLLKVNLLMKKKPEQATTTHPVFVRALAEILLAYGCKVIIGDSPGGPFNENILHNLYKVTGMASVAQETEAILNFNTKSVDKENPNGLILKKLTVTDMIHDVDKVISVSKLKTHGMMTFTGAVKNMFGIVPGIMKAEYHLNMPDYDTFADAIVDICLCANPVLSFMDGIVGMEGEGPSSGETRQVNAVIASDSPYHLDKVACSLIKLPFSRVPTIVSCVKRGLCTEGLDDIELSGEPVDNFVNAILAEKNFKIPENRMLNPARRLPPFVMAFLRKFVQPRPVFIHDICIGCGVCADNCPAKVIKMTSGKPNVNLTNCIRCYCCQELCPVKAVSIHRPALLTLLTKK